MNKNDGRTKFLLASQRSEDLTPEILVKSFWVSTALALILTIPPLGILLGVLEHFGNLLVGTALAFGLHFMLLALASRISSMLTALLSE
jgi:hypothetical protein